LNPLISLNHSYFLSLIIKTGNPIYSALFDISLCDVEKAITEYEPQNQHQVD
ncbi:unnamed protein product, partial [Brassica rapa subsp. trilocularis]